MKRWAQLVVVLTAVLVLLPAANKAWAGISGQYRIYLMNNTFVEGDVKEQPDGSYDVKTKHGASVHVKKNEVLRVVPLKDLATPSPGVSPGATGAKRSPLRREITSAEIEEIIGDVKAEAVGDTEIKNLKDLMAPLPVDEDSVKEMLSQVGITRDNCPLEKQKGVMLKEHFAMVYTSSDKSARELASRLESVWRWNIRFMDMLGVPARRPEHKLELFYFGTYKEFEAYSLNRGMDVSGGVLGYYAHDNNRAHFFDMMTWPRVEYYINRLKERDIPFHIRQFITNSIKRWVEFQNTHVIQHETGHQIHFNIGLFPKYGPDTETPVPTWLVEGTTMMFEFPPSAAGACLGTVNHYRLDQIRKILGPPGNRPGADFWKRFVIDNRVWYSGGGLYYPVGWSLVDYLYHEKRKEYAKYLQKVFGRDDTMRLSMTDLEKEFEDCFGRVDEKWVEKFYKYVDGLQLRPSLLPPDLSGLGL